METTIVEQFVLLAAVGAVVLLVTRRLKIPYTVGLVVAGVVIAFLPFTVRVPFTKEFLFVVLLPPLIFEAALFLNWQELRRDLLLVSTYATAGVVFSAIVTAAVMHFAIGWVLPAAIVFGVLIAATDPVAIIATFEEANATGRLRTLIESESLFNDSTAAVGFTLAVAFAVGESVGVGSAAWQLFSSVAGAVITGTLFAAITLLVVISTKNYLVELTMSAFAGFGSFWVAEYFGFSGILSCTVAGLVIGNRIGRGPITERGEESMEHFWEFIAFGANSIIFILLGINLASQDFRPFIAIIIVGILAVLAGRAFAVYPISRLFSCASRPVSSPHRHTLFWGGLRGALALALALGVPESVPYRQEILIVTFGVVAFSVFIQGWTVVPLMRKFGELQNSTNNQDA